MSGTAKLPVWKTTFECYRLVFANLGQLVRISWLWVLVMIPVYAVISAAIWYLTQSPDKLEPGAVRTAVVLLPSLPEAIFLSSIAVAWHKLILRGQRQAAATYFQLDCRVGTYSLFALALAAIPTAVTFFPALMVIDRVRCLSVDSGEAVVFAFAALVSVVLGVILWPLLTILLLRFCLIFPAIALGQNLSLSESWRATRGNSWRLAWISFLCWLPCLFLLVLVFFSSWDTPDQPSLLYAISTGPLEEFSYVIPTIFGVTFLSLAYRHFIEPTAPAL